MIVIKLISGLGNQLFQYAVARQLSLTHNVPLKLDTSFFGSQDLRSFKLHQYAIGAEVATQAEVASLLDVYSSRSLSAKLYRRAESYLPKQYHRYFKETEWWVYEPALMQVKDRAYLDGYWQHHRYFANLYPRVLEELTVREAYTGSALAWLHELQSQPAAVSVHIRRGDYLTDKAAFSLMGILPLEYYHQAIAYISQRVPAACFYFFSDDLDWVKDNLRPAQPSRYVEIAGGAKDYVELDLMSKCKHNIIANSSFSWWGAFLNRNTDKIVVAPHKWVVPEDTNNKIKLQFPSWVKL